MRRGGVLAVTVDPPARNKQLQQDLEVEFPILADTDREVVRAYGLCHEGAAPDGTDTAIPTQLLLRQDGSILWRHVAKTITDRADPGVVLGILDVQYPR